MNWISSEDEFKSCGLNKRFKERVQIYELRDRCTRGKNAETAWRYSQAAWRNGNYLEDFWEWNTMNMKQRSLE